MCRKATLFAIVLIPPAALTGCAALFPRADDATVASRLEQARTLYNEKRLDEARELFQDLADRSVYDAACAEEATFYVAECYYQQHDYARAHKAYRALLQQFRSGRYFDTAVRREFTIGAAYCTGRVSGFWKRRSFGAQILEQALSYQPFGQYSAQARLLLGHYHFEKGDYGEALGQYELLIQEYADSPEAALARYRRALCLYNTVQGNRYDSREVGEAVRSLQEARDAVAGQAASKAAGRRLNELSRKLDDLREVSAKENYDLARFFLRNGNKTAAAAYFHEVLENAPRSSYAERSRRALDRIAEEKNR